MIGPYLRGHGPTGQRRAERRRFGDAKAPGRRRCPDGRQAAGTSQASPDSGTAGTKAVAIQTPQTSRGLRPDATRQPSRDQGPAHARERRFRATTRLQRSAPQTRNPRMRRLSVPGSVGGTARSRRTWFPAKQGGVNLRLASLRALLRRRCASVAVTSDGPPMRADRASQPLTSAPMTPQSRSVAPRSAQCRGAADLARYARASRRAGLAEGAARHDRPSASTQSDDATCASGCAG